ncbi:bL21 family ribosomal protein [Desulfurella sp.]|uniref:bL21 family ribosomal protein n=1 Tax=Desulfurella sp. TaxID=1962857 RepID=UPI00345C1297
MFLYVITYIFIVFFFCNYYIINFIYWPNVGICYIKNIKYWFIDIFLYFKFKRRKGFKKKIGHRQHFTQVKITQILA